MNHNYVVLYNGVKIRPIKKADIELLREWRNNTENSKYLRQIGHITKEMQQKWYEDYLTDSSIITFAIEDTLKLKRMVGTVSIYDFNGRNSDCGKIMIGDPEAAGNNFGFRGELLSLHVGFKKMGIEEYDTEVNVDNIKSIKTAAKLGFRTVGERPVEDGNGREYYYKMTKDEFYDIHPEIKTVPIIEEEDNL